jgi:hypothetical protein
MILGKTCCCTDFSFPRHFLLTLKQSANILPNFSSFCSLSRLSLVFQFHQTDTLLVTPPLSTGCLKPTGSSPKSFCSFEPHSMPLTGRNGSGAENYLGPKMQTLRTPPLSGSTGSRKQSSPGKHRSPVQTGSSQLSTCRATPLNLGSRFLLSRKLRGRLDQWFPQHAGKAKAMCLVSIH